MNPASLPTSGISHTSAAFSVVQELLRFPPEYMHVQYVPIFRITVEGVESIAGRDLDYLLGVLPGEVAGIVEESRPLFEVPPS